MRSSNLFVLVVALATCAAAAAQTTPYQNIGRLATAEEIQAWDISVSPAGKELPPGKGTAKEGASIYTARCAVCHGQTMGEAGPLGPALVAKKGGNLRGTIAAWPYATSIWDFINRAMPRFNEGTLKPDQVYALTAFLLFRSGIIKEDDVMDAKSVTELQMPYRNAYVPSNLAEIGNIKKRGCNLGHCPGPEPTAAH
ncbi:MAG: cytochrome c [Candidatus Acidiferrales bacterium]